VVAEQAQQKALFLQEQAEQVVAEQVVLKIHIAMELLVLKTLAVVAVVVTLKAHQTQAEQVDLVL
jgi:hypothetical protein